MLLKQVVEVVHVGDMMLAVVVVHDVLCDNWLKCA